MLPPEQTQTSPPGGAVTETGTCPVHAGRSAVQTCPKCERSLCDLCFPYARLGHDLCLSCQEAQRVRRRNFQLLGAVGGLVLLLLLTVFVWWPQHQRAEAQAAYQKATDFVMAGETEKARGALEQALALDPRRLEIYPELAALYEREGRLDAAVAAMKKAAELSPGEATTWATLGHYYLLNQQYDEALQAFTRSRDLNPGFSDVCAEMGVVYDHLGQLEKAAEMYREAIKLDDTLIDVRVSLANVLGESGDPGAAADVLEEVVTRVPQAENVNEVKARIEALRKEAAAR